MLEQLVEFFRDHKQAARDEPFRWENLWIRDIEFKRLHNNFQCFGCDSLTGLGVIKFSDGSFELLLLNHKSVL